MYTPCARRKRAITDRSFCKQYQYHMRRLLSWWVLGALATALGSAAEPGEGLTPAQVGRVRAMIREEAARAGRAKDERIRELERQLDLQRDELLLLRQPARERRPRMRRGGGSSGSAVTPVHRRATSRHTS